MAQLIHPQASGDNNRNNQEHNKSIFESDHDEDSSSSSQFLGDAHAVVNPQANEAPHLRPNSIHHQVKLKEHPAAQLLPQQSPHNGEEASPINTLLDMGYPQHMIDRLEPSSNKDIPALVDEMEKMFKQENNQERDEHKNPYLDTNLLHVQQQQFSRSHNQEFVQAHDASEDNESCTSSSSQQMLEDIENKQNIQQNANNEHGNEVYDDDDDEADDDELRLDDLIPQCVKQIFALITAKQDIEVIKTKMDKHNVLNHNDSAQTEHDWNDFRYSTKEDEDGVTILEHAFNVQHYELCIYLVTEKKLIPEICCEHIICKLISKIKEEFNKNGNDNGLEEMYYNIMKQMISELRAPADKQFKVSFKILKDLLVASYTLESKFLCKMIKELLEETIDDKECFVDSLRDKLDAILCIVRDYGLKCNDSHKREVWNVLFECIVCKKGNMDWITALTHHWTQWIFKDWIIFQVILDKVDRFDEEYKRLHPDVNDIRSLLWNIMKCMDNKANTNGAILMCNYIYEHRQNESFANFIHQQLNDTIMDIITDATFSRKAKHKYVSILFYFFITIERAMDYRQGIISTMIQKYIRLDANNDPESVKIFDKMLYNIFIMQILRFSKGNKVNATDCWEHVNKEEKQVTNWCESIKIENETMKHLIQKIINRVLTICKIAKRGRYIEQHCNVIVQFALKLAKFVKTKERNAEHIILHIFSNYHILHILSDLDHDSNEFNYAACHQLQAFVYQILPNYFTSRLLENVHVIFLIENQTQMASNEEKSSVDDAEANNLVHIHLMNISIVNGMKPKQICQFLLSCLRVRYKTNTSYNSAQMEYDALHYKLWSKSKWKPIRFNDTLHKNKNGNAAVLLITNNEDTNTPLSIILSHIHQYALMSLRTGDDVYYFDQAEVGKKRNIWVRGNIKEIKRSTDDKMFEMINIENDDSKDRMFANDDNKNQYFFDVLDTKQPCFQYIIPSTLKHWLPASYFKEYDRDCSWQTPHFSFIASLIICPVSELFMGQIKHNHEDKCRGAINIINGEIPYPPDQMQFVKLDIDSKIDFNAFVDCHYNKIDNECDENEQQKYVWSAYVHWSGLSLHDTLVADMENIYCMKCDCCIMYLLTAQHLQRIAGTKSINFDFLRYGRERSMDKDCFVLTIFEEQSKSKYYSSLLSERFAVIYHKDLECLCPQQFAYSFPNYVVQKKKNEKNRKDKHTQSYSKKQNKQKVKKEREALIKDWDKAFKVIEEWAKKNRNSIPRDTEAWEAVIRTQIIKSLYPCFQGEKDVEQLAIRAASIDVTELNQAEEASAKSQNKAKPPLQYQPRQPPPQSYPQKSPPHYHPQRRKHVQSAMVPYNKDSSLPSQSQQEEAKEEGPEYIPRSKKNYQPQPPQNNHPPMNHASYNQHSQPMDDSQSVHSAHSVANKINYSTEKIQVCAIKPVHVESYAHLPVEEQQNHITHGFIVGCPQNEDVSDIPLQFRSIEELCGTFLLRIASAKFVYVQNYEELSRYHDKVNETTLFFYVRFTGREHAMNFVQLDKNILGFHVKVPVKKIRKYFGCKPFYNDRYTASEKQEVAHLVEVNGNGTKRNYNYFMESLIEQMYRFEDNHIHNRIAHDLITVPTKELLRMNDEWGVSKNEQIKLAPEIGKIHDEPEIQLIHDNEPMEEAKCNVNEINDAPHISHVNVMSQHKSNIIMNDDYHVNNGHDIDTKILNEDESEDDDDDVEWSSYITTFESLQHLEYRQCLQKIAALDFNKLAQEMKKMSALKKENKMLKQRINANK